jgi:transposase-like protein
MGMLQRTHGNVSATAREFEVTQRTMRRWISELGLQEQLEDLRDAQDPYAAARWHLEQAALATGLDHVALSQRMGIGIVAAAALVEEVRSRQANGMLSQRPTANSVRPTQRPPARTQSGTRAINLADIQTELRKAK